MFKAARKAFDELKRKFTGNREYLVVPADPAGRTVLRVRPSLDIPSLFHQEPLRKRILIALNIDLIVQHVLALRASSRTLERIEPVFDEE